MKLLLVLSVNLLLSCAWVEELQGTVLLKHWKACFLLITSGMQTLPDKLSNPWWKFLILV
jgi:hypothetical protein